MNVSGAIASAMLGINQDLLHLPDTWKPERQNKAILTLAMIHFKVFSQTRGRRCGTIAGVQVWEQVNPDDALSCYKVPGDRTSETTDLN